jgi:hypothetical protein
MLTGSGADGAALQLVPLTLAIPLGAYTGGLTVLLTVVVSFNPRYLWHLWEQHQGSGEVRP